MRLTNMRKLAYFRVYLLKILYRLIVALLYRNKQKRKAVLKNLTTQTEKKYLQRYLYVLHTDEPSLSPCPKIIWVCWLQGLDKAPDIVQKCFVSIQKYCADFEIKVITFDNVKQYADLPDYIWQKFYEKKISNTQFSDLLRLALLDKNGGYWIDATVFLTGNLPEKIVSADFFAFYAHTYLKNNSWFLKASAGDLIVSNMKNLMFEYWKYENRLMNYFLYHLFFDLMMEKNALLAQKWNETPLLYDDCYDLQIHLFTPFSETLWQKIKDENSIHKLTYKYKKDRNLAGTFLEKLLNDELL